MTVKKVYLRLIFVRLFALRQRRFRLEGPRVTRVIIRTALHSGQVRGGWRQTDARRQLAQPAPLLHRNGLGWTNRAVNVPSSV